MLSILEEAIKEYNLALISEAKREEFKPEEQEQGE